MVKTLKNGKLFVYASLYYGVVAQYLCLALVFGLGWALHYASLAGYFTDVLAIVAVTVALVEIKHGKLAPH